MADTDILKRLLEAEREAERMVEEAEHERGRLIEEARKQAREADQRFEQRIPELQADEIDGAKQRAKTDAEELRRRVEQHKQKLHDLAQRNTDKAVNAVVEMILDGERS